MTLVGHDEMAHGAHIYTIDVYICVLFITTQPPSRGNGYLPPGYDIETGRSNDIRVRAACGVRICRVVLDTQASMRHELTPHDPSPLPFFFPLAIDRRSRPARPSSSSSALRTQGTPPLPTACSSWMSPVRPLAP